MLLLLSLALATCSFANDDDLSSVASDDERSSLDWATPELRDDMNFWFHPESKEEIPYAMRGWNEVAYEIEGCPNTRLNGVYMPQYQPNTDPAMRMFGCWAHSDDMGKEDHESRKLMFWHAPLKCAEIGCQEDACDRWHTRPNWILADATAAEATMYVAEGRDPQPGALDEISVQQPAEGVAWHVTMGCANGWRRQSVAMQACQLAIPVASYAPAPGQACSAQQLESVQELAQASSAPQLDHLNQQLEDIQARQEYIRARKAQQLEYLQASHEHIQARHAQQLEHVQEHYAQQLEHVQEHYAQQLEHLQARNAQQMEHRAQQLKHLLQEFAQPSSAQQTPIVQQLRRSNAQAFSSASGAQQASSVHQLRRSNVQQFFVENNAK